jgi:hypothetical protein
MSILFLSANTAYMMSPFTPASDGRANRVITRTGPFGPLSEAERTTYARVLGPFDSAGPDEGQLIGARTTRAVQRVPATGSAPVPTTGSSPAPA